MGKHETPFETEDPMEFIKSLEAESRYFHEMKPLDRMKQASRMGTIHFGKGPEERESEEEPDSQDEPEEEPALADTLSAEPEEVVEEGPVLTIESEELVARRSPHALLEAVQPGVADSLQSFMRAWFGFYFVTGEGTGRERLDGPSPDYGRRPFGWESCPIVCEMTMIWIKSRRGSWKPMEGRRWMGESYEHDRSRHRVGSTARC